MTKVLLAEDDEMTVTMIVDALAPQKFQVDIATTGVDAREKLKFYQYDVIVMDWGLPGVTGIELCREVRNSGVMTPIIMLTGKDSIHDKETGFNSGVDDYLTKPFLAKELLLRISALLRRPANFVGEVFQCREIILDTKAKRVTKNGIQLRLRPKEFDLLEFLLRHKGTVFSTEAILERVWASESDSASDAIFTCVKRLRQQIDDKDGPSLITTVRGSGYMIDCTEV
jgi:DNA-binding response OmpR family regulator